MAGRRVMRRTQQRNPLYLLFIGQLLAIVLLLAVAITLGTKLTNARRALDSANTQLEQLKASARQQDIVTEEPPADTASEQTEVPPADSEAQPPEPAPQTAEQQPSAWLDLSGHPELAVLPDTLFDHYFTYFTNAGVNLRSGPGTEYKRIKVLNLNEQVEAAAKNGSWTFVKSGDQFGWISSDYLSPTITQAP